MKSGIRMAEVSWPVIEQAFIANLPIIIPLGAGCKEHGLHLPMNTDLILAEYLAAWVIDHYPVLVAPTVPYNFFPSFSEYPGSATLSYEVSVNFFVDLCGSWYQQGAKQFYVLNTGISTNKVLSEASKRLESSGIPLNFCDFSELHNHPEIKRITEQKRGTHADEIETSIMLYIKPEVVDLTKAKPEENADFPGPLTRDVKARTKTISLTGARGNPTLATREKGKIAMGVLLELLKKELSHLF
ncbi:MULTISPECIES: creatininase family protein [Legionella]|uniref:Creatinine amidohydrolase n=1 Tax=Legionella drozanskii LLAP-1 TaxID=1212489 RepID=A0A0W0SXN5_9GAMM|nr:MULTISPECIES: creatininase family protein [Legionella]KTC88118.1 Creatinine amidohydrolase [Legionella drozanskii LLAP-1]PJE08033.1 MAG: creatininase [Legionella sp.]